MATLLARWKVIDGEDSGSTWAEHVGGHDGTMVGAAFQATSRPDADGEVVFDGVDDRVDVGSSSVFALSRDFTISAWVNISVSGGVGGSQAILSRDVGGFYLRTNTDKLNFLSSNAANILTAGTALTRGVWHHVAATISAGGTATLTLYLDGVPDGSTTTSLTFAGSALAIGADVGTDNWPGSMDDVRIYDGAMTAGEVLALFEGEAEPPPVGPYVHDTFTGTPVADLTTRSGEVGATWTRHPTAVVGATAAWRLSAANRAFSTSQSYATSHYLASGTPPGATYDVIATLRFLTNLSDASIGLSFKYSASVDSGYRLVYQSYQTQWELQKVTAGSMTSLGIYDQALSAGADYEVRVELTGAGIVVKVDGVTRITSADATYTAAGRVGLWALGDQPSTDTAGIHVDRIAVVDAGDGWPGAVGGGGIVPAASNHYRRLRAG